MQKQRIIFITGATGFVGSNIAYKFLKKGYKVKLLVRGRRAVSVQERIYKILFELCGNNLAEFKEIKKNVAVIEGDVTQSYSLGISEEILKSLSKEVNTIFHCAAFMSFDKGKKEELFKQNVEGTKNVLEFALKLGISSFHYLSTAYLCGRELNNEISEEKLDRPALFNNLYEETKFEAEKIVREYKNRYGMSGNIYRPSIIVGDSKSGKTQSLSGYYMVIRAMYILREKVIKHLRKGDSRLGFLNVRLDKGKLYLPLRVPWLRNRPLNLVPIDYVVNVIFEIFRNESSFNKTFSILHPTPSSVGEVLEYTCKALNISTFQIVDPKEFLRRPKTFVERFLLKNVKEYLPYLEIPEPHFRNENTLKVIENIINPPTIDSDFICKLVNYCIQSNWRKEIYLNDKEAEIEDVSI